MRVNDGSQLVLAQLSLQIVRVCARTRVRVYVPFSVRARALLRSKFNYTGQNV